MSLKTKQYYKLWERSRSKPSQWLTQNIRHEDCPIDLCQKLLIKVPKARYGWSYMEEKKIHEVELPKDRTKLLYLKWKST